MIHYSNYFETILNNDYCSPIMTIVVQLFLAEILMFWPESLLAVLLLNLQESFAFC